MSSIVIDANIGLALVVPLQYSNRVEKLFVEWRDQSIEFVVPALWGYEIASALRKAISANILVEDEALAAVEHLWALDIQEIPETISRLRQALVWAERLGQTVAYDAQYLVVADEYDIPLWTADRSLTVKARASGADWVRWIEDSD